MAQSTSQENQNWLISRPMEYQLQVTTVFDLLPELSELIRCRLNDLAAKVGEHERDITPDDLWMSQIQQLSDDNDFPAACWRLDL